MPSLKTILATTYAVHPTKGSEDAMGWNYVLQIARFNKVISITRENNREAIEAHIASHPSPIFDNITFLYFDLPYWMRFWKKGGRGAMIYYWMWQRGLPSFVKKQKIKYDVVHNATFPNDWTPSYLWKLNKPFVWGPIGHHPLIPSQYLKPYNIKYYIKDRLTWLVKNFFWKLSIGLKRTARKADFIYAMNSSVADKINLKPNKHIIKPSVATQDFGYNSEYDGSSFRIISAGRFVPLKGFDLTILSFAKFLSVISPQERKKASLTLVGSGPEESYLRSLIAEHSLEDNVQIISWIERSELMKKMKTSSVFLFPSHEGAGMVVAEALSFALPVICLNNCGPGEFINETCGISIKEQSYNDTVDGLADSLFTLFTDPTRLKQMRIGARSHFESEFHWDRRGESLSKIYEEILGQNTESKSAADHLSTLSYHSST
ncbi:MAG: glycosyltransferase family 4 protein [Bacteroidia bacterium]